MGDVLSTSFGFQDAAEKKNIPISPIKFQALVKRKKLVRGSREAEAWEPL